MLSIASCFASFAGHSLCFIYCHRKILTISKFCALLNTFAIKWEGHKTSRCASRKLSQDVDPGCFPVADIYNAGSDGSCWIQSSACRANSFNCLGRLNAYARRFIRALHDTGVYPPEYTFQTDVPIPRITECTGFVRDLGAPLELSSAKEAAWCAQHCAYSENAVCTCELPSCLNANQEAETNSKWSSDTK